MVHNEDHLHHDTLKLFGQAFDMTCLVDAKAKVERKPMTKRLRRTWSFIRR